MALFAAHMVGREDAEVFGQWNPSGIIAHKSDRPERGEGGKFLARIDLSGLSKRLDSRRPIDMRAQVVDLAGDRVRTREHRSRVKRNSKTNSGWRLVPQPFFAKFLSRNQIAEIQSKKTRFFHGLENNEDGVSQGVAFERSVRGRDAEACHRPNKTIHKLRKLFLGNLAELDDVGEEHGLDVTGNETPCFGVGNRLSRGRCLSSPRLAVVLGERENLFVLVGDSLSSPRSLSHRFDKRFTPMKSRRPRPARFTISESRFRSKSWGNGIAPSFGTRSSTQGRIGFRPTCRRNCSRIPSGGV